MRPIIFTFVLSLIAVFSSKADVVISENPVEESNWKEGNCYFLKFNDYFLSLDHVKTDSVIVKKMNNTTDKALIDYALWEITSTSTAGGSLYRFKNKRTQAFLSFEAVEHAKPNLAEGIDTWTFKDGVISAYYDNAKKTMALTVEENELKLANLSNTAFKVYAPDTKFVLTAEQLGDGFKVFRLGFDKTYEGNLFEGKDLLAEDIAGSKGYVTLQIQGDETFDDGTAKYLGIDTLKTSIIGAKDVFGAKFSLDSTRTIVRPNSEWQKFKFLVDLKNDSLNICIAAAPNVAGDLSSETNVKIVSAGLADKYILTVAQYDDNGYVDQGELPSVRIKKGNPGTIDTGTGVYFLKSASKGETAGKYIVKYDNGLIVTTGKTPSVHLPEGQWYVKETNGMYSIADRNTNTSIVRMEAIYPVQGMTNTFTFGNNKDSITVEYQRDISLNELFLGSRHFTSKEMADNGYLLNPSSSVGGGNDLFVISADSILQVKSGGNVSAVIFKLEVKRDSVPNEETGLGALSLGDTLYHTTYTLKELFTDKYVAYDEEKKVLKLSKIVTNEFLFMATSNASEYTLNTDKRFVSYSVATSNLILSDEAINFSLAKVNAPEYASFENRHARLSSDGKSLTMNPFKFLAEMKMEGQEITKANYETENFSLWIEKAPSSPDKQLYYIAKGVFKEGASVPTMYYLVSLRDSSKFDSQQKALAGFITGDDIKTMKNSPALFAFKITENGGFILESQKEINDYTKEQYIGIVNNIVVMSSEGVEFDIENAPAPVASENTVDTKVSVVGKTGSVTIMNAAGKKISIVNILGQVMASKHATSDYFIMPAGRGVVFVVIEGEPTQKALIR